MSLRTVALDTPRPRDRAIVCDPTGCAVVMCSSTMARRMAAFRSSSSIGTRFYRVPAGRARPLECQQEPGGDLVAEEPAAAREDGPVSLPGQETDVDELVDARDHAVRIGLRARKLDPTGGAHGQDHGLRHAGGGVEGLAPSLGRGARPHRGDVALGRADVPPPATGGVAVGGAADGGVVTALPVEEVVAALVAGAGPVRDLVPGEAGGGQAVVGHLVLRGLVVVVGRFPPAGRDRPAERGTRLDGQGVRAHVPRLQRQGGVEGRLPVGDALARRAVDEVEVEALDPGGARPVDGAGHVVGVVRAAQRGEHVRRASTARRTTRGSPRRRGTRASLARSTESGLHSTVTSASAARGIASRIRVSAAASSNDGVPPPKNTLLAGAGARRPRSRTQASTYSSTRWARSVQVAKSQ